MPSASWTSIHSSPPLLFGVPGLSPASTNFAPREASARAPESGMYAATRVPPSAGLSTRSRPSRAASRSRRPKKPVPSARAPPMPSSRTWTTSAPSVTRAVTAACAARACLATLVRASATTKYAVASTGRKAGPPARRSPPVPTSGRSARPLPSATHPGSGPPAGCRGELAQLAHRPLGVVERLGQQSRGALVAVLHRAVCQLERDDGVHESLLRPVMKIPDDPTALLVGRGHDPRPGRRHLRARFAVGDRRPHELRELRHAGLGAGQHRLLVRPGGDHQAPWAALDNDRRSELRAGAEVTKRGEAVRRTSGGRMFARERHPGPRSHLHAGVAVDRNDRGRTVRLVSQQVRRTGAEELAHLGGDGIEDLGGGDALRDQRRYAAQRRLLV